MESIKEKLKKSKSCLNCFQYLQNPQIFSLGIVISLILAIFGAIRLKKLFDEQSPVKVVEAAFQGNLSGKEGSFVASKTGKSYYFPWCGSVNQIKASNRVWFVDRSTAVAKGYKPASNCHGLK